MQNFFGAAWPFIITTALITLNEMGDKSQFMAMAFATRMKSYKVMLGIFLAVTLMGGLGVAAGALLASVPGWQGWVHLISSALFLLFGIWSLKEEKEDGENTRKRRGYGDVAAVFVSFLFAEMGDKTQLVTISLAAQYAGAPLLILAGTVAGMLVADGLGIFVGVVMHKKLPEHLLKYISAALFFFFGFIGIWGSLRETFHQTQVVSAVIVLLAAVITFSLSYSIYRKQRPIKKGL